MFTARHALIVAPLAALVLMGATSTASAYHPNDRRPAQRHHQHQPAHRPHVEKVLVQRGHYVTQHIPPVYATRYDACGRPIKVIVRPATVQRVWVPDRYEYRPVRVVQACPPPQRVDHRHSRKPGIEILAQVIFRK